MFTTCHCISGHHGTHIISSISTATEISRVCMTVILTEEGTEVRPGAGACTGSRRSEDGFSDCSSGSRVHLHNGSRPPPTVLSAGRPKPPRGPHSPSLNGGRPRPTTPNPARSGHFFRYAPSLPRSPLQTLLSPFLLLPLSVPAPGPRHPLGMRPLPTSRLRRPPSPSFHPPSHPAELQSEGAPTPSRGSLHPAAPRCPKPTLHTNLPQTRLHPA